MTEQKKSIKINKRLLFILSLVVVAVGLSLGYYTFIPRSISNKAIRIKCRYMAYACGECTSQYRIEDIYTDKEKYKFLIGKDVDVDFKKGKLSYIEKQTEDCIICYDYYVTGKIKYNLFKKYYVIEAEQCNYKLRFDSCCNKNE